MKLIFDVLKLIYSYHIRTMNVHMGQKIIDISLIYKRSTKKCCLAHFFIKQLYKFPYIAEVAYYVVEHKRLYGSIAHGPLDPSSNSRKF